MIEGKYPAFASRLDEVTLRLWAAVEARTLGRGGVSAVAKAIGMSRTAIQAGLEELASTTPSAVGEAGIKVSGQEFAELAIERDRFHGEWNYRLVPRELPGAKRTTQNSPDGLNRPPMTQGVKATTAV